MEEAFQLSDKLPVTKQPTDTPTPQETPEDIENLLAIFSIDQEPHEFVIKGKKLLIRAMTAEDLIFASSILTASDTPLTMSVKERCAIVSRCVISHSLDYDYVRTKMNYKGFVKPVFREISRVSSLKKVKK